MFSYVHVPGQTILSDPLELEVWQAVVSSLAWVLGMVTALRVNMHQHPGLLTQVLTNDCMVLG